MMIRTTFVKSTYNERTRKYELAESRVCVNSEQICYIDMETHQVYFAAPDGSGMSTYNLHRKIADCAWADFIRQIG